MLLEQMHRILYKRDQANASLRQQPASSHEARQHSAKEVQHREISPPRRDYQSCSRSCWL